MKKSRKRKHMLVITIFDISENQKSQKYRKYKKTYFTNRKYKQHICPGAINILYANMPTCIFAYLHSCILVYLHTCMITYLHTCILHTTGCPTKHYPLGFCLISLATNMLESQDIIHQKGGIHCSVLSKKNFSVQYSEAEI